MDLLYSTGLYSIPCNNLQWKRFWKSICMHECVCVCVCVRVCACMCAKSLQSCRTLCNLMDCSPPGSFIHGILQARILEWVAMPSSKGSSWPRDRTCLLGFLHWQVGSLLLVPPGKPTCVLYICVCMCIHIHTCVYIYTHTYVCV